MGPKALVAGRSPADHRDVRSVLRHVPLLRERARHDIEPPAWTGPGDAKRVLIEEGDDELRTAMTGALRRAGYQTAECAGPGGHGDGRCPLVAGTGCHAVDGADAVVHVLVTSDEPMNEVRAAVVGEDPDLPVIVFAPAPTVARRPDLVEGSQVSTGPLTRTGVVAAVQEALGPP